MFKKDELNIWGSVSDLMTGMMMVFLFISLALMLRLSLISEEYVNVKSQIIADLTKEFPQKELEAMNATINPADGTISFTAKRVTMFDRGNDVLSNNFKANLNNFFPRYLKVLSKPEYKEKILEIRIEGHSSREYNGDPDSDEAYIDNMNLSQLRAKNVLIYVMQLKDAKADDNKKWLRTHIASIGYSNSKATADKQEDYWRDRRVDFRVMLDAESTVEKIKNDVSVIVNGKP